MFTSDKTKTVKYLLSYLIVTVLCSVFGAVYEYFSFGVWSFFMVYSFAAPLVLGAIPLSLICVTRLRTPARAAINLQASGIAALTVGCLYKGMLEIYGTTNSLSNVYWLVGWAFIIAAGIAYLVQPFFANKADEAAVSR